MTPIEGRWFDAEQPGVDLVIIASNEGDIEARLHGFAAAVPYCFFTSKVSWMDITESFVPLFKWFLPTLHAADKAPETRMVEMASIKLRVGEDGMHILLDGGEMTWLPATIHLPLNIMA